MKTSAFRLYLITAAFLLSAAPGLAQVNIGAGRATGPPPPVRANVLTPSHPTVQSGLGGNTKSAGPSQPACNADSSGHYSPNSRGYNPYGYPQYPGPNVPLPTPGTYYANPYDYYNNYNPNNPYGYYQNNGYYNNGYYNNGYNNGYRANGSNNGYYNRGPNGPQPYNTGYPPFQGYSPNNGVRGR